MVGLKDIFIPTIILLCIVYTFIFLDITLDFIQEKISNSKNEKVLKYLILIISIIIHALILIKAYSFNLLELGKLMPLAYLTILASTANVHVWRLDETRPTYYIGLAITTLISITFFL